MRIHLDFYPDPGKSYGLSPPHFQVRSSFQPDGFKQMRRNIALEKQQEVCQVTQPPENLHKSPSVWDCPLPGNHRGALSPTVFQNFESMTGPNNPCVHDHLFPGRIRS